MKHSKLLWPLLGVTASVAAYFGLWYYRRRKIEMRLQSGEPYELTEKEWRMLRKSAPFLKARYPDHDHFLRMEEIKTAVMEQERDNSSIHILPDTMDDEEITDDQAEAKRVWMEDQADALVGALSAMDPGTDLPKMEVVSQEEYEREVGFEKLPLYFYRLDNVLCDDAGIPIAPQYWELYIPDGLIDTIKHDLIAIDSGLEPSDILRDYYTVSKEDLHVHIRNYDLLLDFKLIVLEERYVNAQANLGDGEYMEDDAALDELDDVERRMDDE